MREKRGSELASRLRGEDSGSDSRGARRRLLTRRDAALSLARSGVFALQASRFRSFPPKFLKARLALCFQGKLGESVERNAFAKCASTPDTDTRKPTSCISLSQQFGGPRSDEWPRGDERCSARRERVTDAWSWELIRERDTRTRGMGAASSPLSERGGGRRRRVLVLRL